MTEFQEMYLHDQGEPDGLFFKDTGKEHLQSPVLRGRRYIYVNM